LIEKVDQDDSNGIDRNSSRGDSATIPQAVWHELTVKGAHVLGAQLIGVLQSVRHRGLIPVIRPLIEALRWQAGFWLSDALVQRVLRDAGE